MTLKQTLWRVISLILVASMAACSVAPKTPEAPTLAPPPTEQAAPSPAPAQITERAPTEPPAVTPETGEPLPPVESARLPEFADYRISQVKLPERFAGDYSLPVDLGRVERLADANLSKDQRSLLKENGFAVAAPVPGKFQEFYQVYESQRYSEQPLFATTDAVLHVYHLIFDKMLRDLERERFIGDLEALTTDMLQATLEQYEAVKGTAIEGPALRNVAFFGVAANLLGLDASLPPEAKPFVDAELALIDGAAGPTISPLWDREDLPGELKLIEDYSQYIPRGHYTRSEELKRYFKAMMWYGRFTYRLRDAFETRRALLLVQALRRAQAEGGQSAVKLWQDIYEPTVFIVGKADDLSYFEYGTLSDEIFGADAGPGAFADEGKLQAFVEAAKKLPPPQVNSMWVWIWEDKTEATQGFRFMGQRFTLDAYVFGQMIWRNVGTMSNPRGLPKALDFFAAMGSDEALDLLRGMGEDQYSNFDEQMEKVRGEIGQLGLDSWTQNLYWSWLYTLQPLIEPKNESYPAFMRTQAWTRKDLHTALGSWTELKHDTILYAKQVMAEMGGGPMKVPKGYVEPNVEVYARLLALAEMTRSGLQSRGLLSDKTNVSLANLIDLLQFMQTASEKELAGQELSDEEYGRIMFFGGELEALTLAASDCEEADLNACRDLSDRKAALVADVATGLDKQGGVAALEEGVGQPTEIYVVLPGQPLRLGIGAVFTYYEFVVGVEQRLTDEQWQAMVEAGEAPPAPEWTSAFIAP